MKPKSNKTIVLEIYRKLIRDHDVTKVDDYLAEDYTQHSPKVKDGKAGFLELLRSPKKPGVAPSPIRRVVAEGNFVAVHLDFEEVGKRRAVIDLFKLTNGKLTEHWDAIQLEPENHESAITMTNGISALEDTADAEKCKELVKSLFYGIASGIALENDKYFTPGFIEHSPGSALFGRQGYSLKIHRTLGEGNFVFLQGECKSADHTFAQYHILAIEDDKIAEHWSVEQEVPETMAHTNGMF